MAALVEPFYQDVRLPRLGTACPRCRRYAWARLEWLLIFFHEDRKLAHLDKFRELSGTWIICTFCIPPRKWVEFFDKYDPPELEESE